MTDSFDDNVEFDEVVALALAELAAGPAPGPMVRDRLMARIAGAGPAPVGYSFRFAPDDDWLPHPVPGIRMKVLSRNTRTGYATLLLDAQPGTRLPVHRHHGDEDCYVLSGSIVTQGRRLGPGDFVHADAGTQHDVWTDEGARVLLVTLAEDYTDAPPPPA